MADFLLSAVQYYVLYKHVKILRLLLVIHGLACKLLVEALKVPGVICRRTTNTMPLA